MSELYTELLSEVESILNEYGRPAKIKTITSTGSKFNPTLTDSLTDVMIVVGNYDLDLMDKGTIQRGDMQIFLKGDVDLHVKDKIVDGSDEYSIVDIQRIKPGDTNLLYIIQGRM